MVGSAQQNIGIHTLLNYLELYMPCPTELFSGQRIGEDPLCLFSCHEVAGLPQESTRHHRLL